MQEKIMQMCDLIKKELEILGVSEIEPSPFVCQEMMDAANIDVESWERDFAEQKDESGEKVCMRTILMPTMLEVLGEEVAAGNDQLRIFEIGKTYTKNYVVPEAAPFECWNLSLGVYGKDEDLSSIAGMITTVLEKMGIADVEFLVEKEYGTYHPEQCARIVTKDFSGQEVELGIMGEFHPQVKEHFALNAPAFGAELFFDLIAEFAERAEQYHQSMTQPFATVDAEILSAEAAQLDELERQIKALFGVVNQES